MCTNSVLQSLPRVFLVSHTSKNSSRMRTSRLPTIGEWRGWGPCTVSSNLNKFEHGWGGGLYVFASRIFSLDLRRRHNFQRSTKLPISITSGWSKGSVDEPPPPPWPKIFSISCSFRKFWQNHMLAPHQPPGGRRPLQRGILDPPLITVFKVRTFYRIDHGSIRITQWKAALYRHKTDSSFNRRKSHDRSEDARDLARDLECWRSDAWADSQVQCQIS